MNRNLPAPESKVISAEDFDKIRRQANELNKKMKEAEEKKKAAEQMIKDMESEIQKNNSAFYKISSVNRGRADLYIRAVEQKEIVKDTETIMKPIDTSLASDTISFKADKKILAELKEQDLIRVDALVNLLYLVGKKLKTKGLKGSYSVLKEDHVEITFSYDEHASKLTDLIALTYFEKQDFHSTGSLGLYSHTTFEIPSEKVEGLLKDLKKKSYADLLLQMMSEIPAKEQEDFLGCKLEDVIKIASENNNCDDFENALAEKKVEERQKKEEAKTQQEQEARQRAFELEEKARKQAREKAKQDEINKQLKAKEHTERKQPNACQGLITTIARLFHCPSTRPKSQDAHTANSQEVKRQIKAESANKAKMY